MTITTVTSSGEASVVSPDPHPVLAYTGRLTSEETRRWGWSIARRMALRFYLRKALPLFVVMAAVALLTNHSGTGLTLRHVAIPLIFANVLTFVLMAGRTISLVRAFARDAARDRPETTVRFFRDKVEILTREGMLHQFRYTSLRLRTGSLGLSCEARSVPLFVLPARVVSAPDIDRIIALAASAGGSGSNE